MQSDQPRLVHEFEHLMTGASVDAADIYVRCRRHGAFWSDRVGGWVVARHSQVAEVLRDEARFPPLQSGPGTTAVYGRTVLQMTGHEHRRKIAPLARRLRNPCGDLISELCAMEFEDLPLPHDELLAYALFLFVGGVETTERTLASAVQMLARSGELWERLRANRSLVLPFLAETLRFFPPVHGLTRGTNGASDFDGVRVPGDGKVLAVIGAANRDPGVFDRPNEFLIERFLDTAHREFTAAGQSLAFGAGTHHCTGSMLARLEMEAAIHALLDRFERLELAPPADPPTGYVLRAPSTVWVEACQSSRRPPLPI